MQVTRMYYMYVCYISLVHCYFKIIARERVCQTFWLSVRVFVKRLGRVRIWKHTLKKKYINLIFSCTYRPVIEQQPAQFLKVSAWRSTSDCHGKQRHASRRYSNIYLSICLYHFGDFCHFGLWSVPGHFCHLSQLHPSPTYVWMRVLCVCILILSATSNNTPVRTPTHKKTPLNH